MAKKAKPVERTTPKPKAPPPRCCSLCGIEARGFFYQKKLGGFGSPSYAFCSFQCMDVATNLLINEEGFLMSDRMTDMEQQAIKDARHQLAAALTEMGLMEPFKDRTAADIDKIIQACVVGFRTSMQKMTMNGDIPFGVAWLLISITLAA